MKKRILLLILTGLLSITLLLSSCGGAVNSIYDILKEDIPYDSTVMNASAVNLPELDGYVLQDYNSEFAIFSTVSELGAISYKVLSFRSRAVVRTLAEVNSFYSFELFDDVPAFVVTKTVIDPTPGLEQDEAIISTEYALCDATGTAVATSDSADQAFLFGDWLIFDYVAYSCDENGMFSKVIDVPEYLYTEGCDAWNDEYFYVVIGKEVTVYDRQLNSVLYWSVPYYASDDYSIFFLNGGDILVQYVNVLSADAKRYDFLRENSNDEMEKCDLVTLRVDVETGKEYDLDMPFLLFHVTSYNEIIQEDADAVEFLKEFDNYACIAPIENEKIAADVSKLDIVHMNDKGEIKDSVLFVEMQSAQGFLPVKIAENVYRVGLITNETALINKKGEIQHKLSGSFNFVDGYVVGDQAIYDADMNVVYNLRANKGEVLGVIDNTVFIQQTTGNGYDVLAFRNGEAVQVHSVNILQPDGLTFRLMEDARCYELYNATSGDYSYYNSEGELILTATKRLNVATSLVSEEILMWSSESEVPSYYIFTEARAVVEE